MKKSLVLLGLLTLSSSLFAMNETQELNPNDAKQQLCKDRLKARCALAGSAFLIIATLFNRSTKELHQINFEKCATKQECLPTPLHHYPTLCTVMPMALLDEITRKFSKKPLGFDYCYNITAACSLTAAAALGLYAYTKLTKSKTTIS